MAYPPKLEIDGVEYHRVYSLSYVLFTDRDETGKPSTRARGGVIKIMRESDDNTGICNWATDSAKTNFKPGKAVIFGPEKNELKTLEWENGFITHYEEHIPHTKDRPDDQVYEYFEISAEKIKVQDAEVNN
ncbi:MAG: type VI secretion system tube protein TssD, partial [Candidatus Zixiibacteriota bacterium]